MIFKSTAGEAYSFDPSTGVIHHGAIEFPPDHPPFVCKRPPEDRTLQHLVLEVTQQCNLRCTYCPHTHGGAPGIRRHRDVHMTDEVANNALLLAAELGDSDTVISYYGGEPLLNWPLVRSCIEAVPNLQHRIDTNGDLVTDEIAEFCAANNVGWQISLDGDEYVNDRYRGFGAHDAARAAIDLIRSTAPDAEISISCTIAPPWRLGPTAVYFDLYPDLLGCELNPTVAGLAGSGIYPEPVPLGEWRRHYLHLLAEGGHENIPRLIRALLDPALIRIYHRQQGAAGECVLGGCCDPGVRKLFASATGSLYPCERTVGDPWKIGSVRMGIASLYVRMLHRSFADQRAARGCAVCWAPRICSGCWANEEFDCDQRQDQLRTDLQFYVDVLETGQAEWLSETEIT